MRISNTMMMDHALIDINGNLSNQDQAQQRLSSGKRIQRPQDDPTANARAMALKQSLDQNGQYLSNIGTGQNDLNVTDTALTSLVNVVQRLRQLAIQGQNGTLAPNDRMAIVTESQQLREELRALGNTQVDGRYIFGGLKVDQAPYPSTDVTTSPNDNGQVAMEVAPGVLVNYNVTGVQVFGNTLPGQTANVFAAADALAKTLTDGANMIDIGKTVSTVVIPQFDDALARINNSRTYVGGVINRFEMAKSRLDATNVSLSGLLSSTEDTDMAKETLALNQSEAAYRSALSVGARSIPLSLVDFLR